MPLRRGLAAQANLSGDGAASMSDATHCRALVGVLVDMADEVASGTELSVGNSL